MATLESRVQRVEEHLAAVGELLNGGPTMTWERSVRGRLHNAESELAAIRWARQSTIRSFSNAEKIIALLLALSAAVGPWVALAIGHP